MVHIIKLNADIIKFIHHNIEYTSCFRLKANREALKFAHCLFLTQDKNVLTYQSVTQHKIVQISTLTDSIIPYPLAINLEPISHLETSEINLEIPDCTFATLQTFHDVNCPKYIKKSDLQTSVVKIGNIKTNLEYLDNMKTYTSKLEKLIYTELDFVPTDNAKKYKWDTNLLYDLSHVLKDNYYYYYPSTPNDDLKQQIAEETLTKISKFGYLYRTVFDEDTCTEKKQIIPIAIFSKTIKDRNINALLLGYNTK